MGFVLPSLQWYSSFILGRGFGFELSTVYKSGYATVELRFINCSCLDNRHFYLTRGEN